MTSDHFSGLTASLNLILGVWGGRTWMARGINVTRKKNASMHLSGISQSSPRKYTPPKATIPQHITVTKGERVAAVPQMILLRPHDAHSKAWYISQLCQQIIFAPYHGSSMSLHTLCLCLLSLHDLHIRKDWSARIPIILTHGAQSRIKYKRRGYNGCIDEKAPHCHSLRFQADAFPPRNSNEGQGKPLSSQAYLRSLLYYSCK